MTGRLFRVGQIVPSSNTTMETEVPAMLGAALLEEDIKFTFHSSRAPMKNVSHDELIAMNGHMSRCARELTDARMDVIASACLVAIMSQGLGYHRQTEQTLRDVCREDAPGTKIVTSAGALIDSLHTIGAKRISIITPYMRNLTKLVTNYIESESIEVIDAISLEVPNNLEVGRLDPMDLLGTLNKLRVHNADAVVLSACVQMPSLAALAPAQARFDVPVLSTAAATVFQILRALDIRAQVPGAGMLLSGDYH
ncbi:MAG: maleate isomerase [Gammaproteobacteria bacterium]